MSDQPDPIPKPHLTRFRLATSRLTDASNNEAPSAANQLLIKNTQARRNGVPLMGLNLLRSATDGECIGSATDGLMRNQTPLSVNDLDILTLFVSHHGQYAILIEPSTAPSETSSFHSPSSW
ncbi:hypothetical protein K438DRAFT_1791845 [Mycena galopus ATCC 62051]|nr:hypothetical protein K438DRAFT_1791845 [Mycena galopus ATCC 62051]